MSKGRIPTAQEVEKLRLILSMYQDGTGMLARPDGATLPGWRDFERASALAMSGQAQESKAVFDVLLPTDQLNVHHGLSCEMKRELDRISTRGRVSMELSNSAGKFWDHLGARGINQDNYKRNPAGVGTALIELIHSWHVSARTQGGGNVDLAGSSYLVLSWNRQGWYQLYQFPLQLPDPTRLKWYFPESTKRGAKTRGRCLRGDDQTGTIVEWYGESGGQLKYYPLVQQALWASEPFRLEPLRLVEHGILSRVSVYFPELWAKACQP